MGKENVVQDKAVQETLFPEVDNADSPKKPDGEEPDPNVEKLAALETQISDGKAREERMQITLDALAAKPPALQPVPEQQTPVEVPDPITQPDEYREHIAKETKTYVDGQVNAMRQENAKTKQYDSMWSDFTSQHPDLAKDHIDLVKFNATEALREVTARGLDAQQYLLSNRDRFMDDIAVRTNAMISKIKGTSLDDGRTDGVMPDSPRKITKQGDTDSVKRSTFIDELHELQMKTGFF